MTARDLKIVMPGDKIKFKKGMMNAGCHATLLRVIPGRNGGLDQVEYEFCGQRKIVSHDRFILEK